MFKNISYYLPSTPEYNTYVGIDIQKEIMHLKCTHTARTMWLEISTLIINKKLGF